MGIEERRFLLGRFDYVLSKIEQAAFKSEPFNHLYVENLFSEEDFRSIATAREINLPPQSSDAQLLDTLDSAGYQIINFPGCFDSRDQYLSWHRERNRNDSISSTCEGKGLALRLESAQSNVVVDLLDFIRGKEFQGVLRAKFKLQHQELTYDTGLQKYLDGYEISPHPDILRKALTFMVNINPSPNSESANHHTHYLRFRTEYDYVRRYWEGNPEVERCWVPWNWCESVSVQARNNSMVIFAPAFDTLHGVRAQYDHLQTQRTQLYGNFWFDKTVSTAMPSWHDLEIVASKPRRPRAFAERVFRSLPGQIQVTVRRLSHR